MELTLAHQTETQISVTCDGQFSHTFDLRPLILPKDKEEERLLNDPVGYGKALYNALFAPTAPARKALDAAPERILLIATDDDLDAIPWEYVYSPDGFLVQQCHFVRGLPAGQRVPALTIDTGLPIVAVPSNPLSSLVEPLNIDGEWMRLKEIVAALPFALMLERTRPPTIEQVRNAVANQRHRVVHFMGHGGQFESGAVLCFEKENGDLDLVTAKQFALRVRDNVFLVTLNACVSAAPGSTSFSNLAATLVRQRIPYALGMRLSIHDDDARSFSRAFYNDLARGTPVEEALLQARLTLADSPRPWVVGVPVLYTSLASPAAGFTQKEGTPIIQEHQPHMEVSALPRAEGAFQGRAEDLKRLGALLTGDNRPRVLTIHGGGGQGKTALARETTERFAYAWPSGVWATTLENLPDRALFATDLARFLGINTQQILDPNEVERQVLVRLASRRMLLVLDNAETLVDAVEANNAMAIQLGQFLQRLPSSSVSLLVTSRVQLGWAGEVSHELGGLSPKEGANLFQQCAPQRTHEIDRVLAWNLSEKLEGHPLSLRLLGGAFNACGVSLHAFLQEHEEQLMKAENKYKDLDHPHRSLYACIDTSVRYLNAELRNLLSGLWIFHAPFLPETAAAIFDPDTQETESLPSIVRNQLYTLWQRSLLVRKVVPVRDGTLLFYYLLPTTLPYIEQHMESSYPREVLLARFGAACVQLISFIRREIDRSAAAVTIAQQTEVDLERGLAYFAGIEQDNYRVAWGWILYRLSAPQRALKLLEQALESAQGKEQRLTGHALNDLAAVYQALGQPQQALNLYEQALPIARELGDRRGEATLLNNLAEVYRALGQLQRALSLCEQALPITREVGNREGEATTLNTLALVYQATGQPQRALSLYEQALSIAREMGNRAGEAATLDNLATAYRNTGQPQQALSLYEQVLPIRREMGNRAGEVATLNNLATVYQATGQPQQALNLYEQALPIAREIGDRAGEAATLDNLARVYRALGQLQRALSLCEQALPITREVGDREGEATTLDNLAGVYQATGQPQQALSLYEQALSIWREMGNRAGESATLDNLVGVYQALGQPQQALSLCEQALSITREVGDRAGEAAALNNLAWIYQALSQPQQALNLYEQALPINREVGDRAGEAITLANLAGVYQATGQPQRALSLREQALSIRREMGDRAGEAVALNNLAWVYQALGQPQQALSLCEQALSITREVGDRAREAAALNNLAWIYQALGQPQQALNLYEQALPITREVGDRAAEEISLNSMAYLYQGMNRYVEAAAALEQYIQLAGKMEYPAGEASGLANLSLLLYQGLHRTSEAIQRLEQAIDVLEQAGLHQGAAGQTLGQMRLLLEMMQSGTSSAPQTSGPSTMPVEMIQQIIAGTIAVMTEMPEHRAEWRAQIENTRQDAQQRGPSLQSAVDFFTAVLAILDGQAATLPADHPYAQALTAIQNGIA